VRYAVILENEETSFGAYVPDLPGCIAAGETKEEVLQLIAEAIEFHIEELRERGEQVPPLHSVVETGSLGKCYDARIDPGLPRGL